MLCVWKKSFGEKGTMEWRRENRVDGWMSGCWSWALAAAAAAEAAKEAGGFKNSWGERRRGRGGGHRGPTVACFRIVRHTHASATITNTRRRKDSGYTHVAGFS